MNHRKILESICDEGGPIITREPAPLARPQGQRIMTMASIYREPFNSDYTRGVRFHVVTRGTPNPVNQICSVSQDVDATDFTMRAPELNWSAWGNQTDPATVRAVALALNEATDLLQQWQSDTGKPYKEVLQ